MTPQALGEGHAMTAARAKDQVGRPTREGDLTLELRGMVPIPEDGRYGSRYRIFTVWFAPNLVPAAFFVGVIAGASFIGLSFAWTIVAIVLGNLIGAILPAVLSVMGPRTGMAQLPLSRLAFGKSVVVPGAINWLNQIAWDGVNGLFGAEAAAILFHIPFWIGLVIVIAAQGVVATLGYEVIHTFEKWMSIVLFVIFAILTVKVASIGSISLHASVHGAAAVGSFILLVTIIASFILAWSVYASDYTRYMRRDLPWWTVAWRVAAGLILSAGWLEVLGLVSARLMTQSTTQGIYTLMGKGALGVIAMIGIVLGTVAVDALDDYTGSLSLQATGINIPRPVAAVVVGAGGFLMAFYLHEGDLATKVTNFLLFISYWVTPFAGVVLVHWWRTRKEGFDLSNIMSLSRLPSGIMPLVALVVGFGASVPFMDSTLYQGPIAMGPLHGGDIALYVGFVVAAGVYWVGSILGSPKGEPSGVLAPETVPVIKQHQ